MAAARMPSLAHHHTSYARLVHTMTLVALGVALGALVLTLLLSSRLRTLSRVVDDAISRVGRPASPKRRHRPEALTAALDDLERSLAGAQRDRARLAGAVQTAPLGVVVTDDAGVVLVANPAASRFLGSRLGEAVAEVRVRQAIDRAILSRRAVEVEVEIYTPVRSILEVTAVPLDFGVESVGAVAFIVDVTEGRRVTAMRRDFIANVSHELKTPLAALAVLAETMADGVADAGTMAALAGRVQAEAHRLSDLIDDILDLSQAEADEVHHRAVSLRDVAREVEGDLAGIALDRGVKVTVAPIPDDARVSGDRRQLRVMVANLVENAIKYSKPAGDSGVTPEVRVAVAVEGDRLRIHVSDDGVGIPDAHLGRIFERFYRVDRARSRESGGTGLGLSIVRHIARTHRGEVTARSVEGGGSTFSVDLPVWRAE